MSERGLMRTNRVGVVENLMKAVVSDLKDRQQKGIKVYGKPLSIFNGRDALMDAYEEALDLVMYLRQRLTEIEFENDTVTIRRYLRGDAGKNVTYYQATNVLRRYGFDEVPEYSELYSAWRRIEGDRPVVVPRDANAERDQVMTVAIADAAQQLLMDDFSLLLIMMQAPRSREEDIAQLQANMSESVHRSLSDRLSGDGGR